MANPAHRALTRAAFYLGHPIWLLILAAYTFVWWRTEPDTFDLHGVATLLALAMTFIIQRAQNRDTAALQAKLDELIQATEGARNEVADIDEKEAEEIEEHRERSAPA